MSIDPLQFSLPAFEAPLLKGRIEHNEASSNSFANSLTTAMNNLRDVHNRSNKLIEEYAAGGPIDVSEVMIAIEKTQMTTDFAMQIRNKLIEGYQDITKMQL